MNVRRFWAMVLVLLLALPAMGVAEQTFQRVALDFFAGYDANGAEIFADPVPEDQYTAYFADPAQTVLMVEAPTLAYNPVRISLIYWDSEMGGEVAYTYVNQMTGSAQVTLGLLEGGAYALISQQDGMPAPVQAQLATNPEAFIDDDDEPSDNTWDEIPQQSEPVPEINPNPSNPQTLPEDRETNVGAVGGLGGTFYYNTTGMDATPLAAGTPLAYTQDASYPLHWDGDALWVPVTLLDGTRGYIPLNDIDFFTAQQAAQQEFAGHTSGHGDILVPGTAVTDAAGNVLGYLNPGNTIKYLQDRGDAYLVSNRELFLLVETSTGVTGYIPAANALSMSQEAEASLLRQPPPARETDTALVGSAGAALLAANGSVIRMLEPGEYIEYNENIAPMYTTDGNYRLLGAAVVRGSSQSGYVKLDDVQFLTRQELTDLETPTEPIPSDPPVIAPDRSRYAYINDYSLNIRQDMDMNSTVGQQVDRDDIVKVIETKTDAAGYTWYHVEVIRSDRAAAVGYTGYIRYAQPVDVLRLMSDAEEAALRDELNKPTDPPTNPPTEPPTEPPTAPPVITDPPTAPPVVTDPPTAPPVVTDPPTAPPIVTDPPTAPPVVTDPPTLPPLVQQRGYMRVVTYGYTDLNVLPMVGSSRTAVLSYGEVVYVDGQTYDDAGNVWSLAMPLYENAPTGYVPQTHLAIMTPDEVNNYFATPRPTPSALPTYSPSAFSGYAVLTKDRVNFRSTPGGSVISQLRQGTLVRVTNQVSADGYTWYQTESGGRTGYLRDDMISLLTISQYLQYVSSPSYDQNGNIITPTATINVSGGTSAPTWATPRPGATSTISFVTIPPMSTADPSPSASPDSSASPDPNASASPGGIVGNVSPSPSFDPDATLPPLDVEPTFESETTSGGFSPPGLLLALVVLLILLAGGFYAYSVYNKSRRRQSEAQAKRTTPAQPGKPGEEKPAVRRPVPPTQPGSGQQAKSPTGAGSTTPPRPGTPGTPTAAQRPSSGTQPNPYARPQSTAPTGATRTQDLDNMPRAQVDGRPVGQPPAPKAPGATPGTAAPGTAQQQQPRPAAPSTPPQNPYTRPSAQTGPQGTRLPIAPEPVTPDDTAIDRSKGTDDATPRRRRRRPPTDSDGADS